MQVSYKVHDNLMLLDFNTITALEIIENAKSGLQKKGSLFATQVIKHSVEFYCCTRAMYM